MQLTPKDIKRFEKVTTANLKKRAIAKLWRERNRERVKELARIYNKRLTEERRNKRKQYEDKKHQLLKSKGNKPRNGVVRSCQICDKEFYISPCKTKSSTQKQLCSNECRIKWLRKKNERKCAVCNGVFYCNNSQLRLRKRKTCSMKCRGIYYGQLALRRAEAKGTSEGQKRRIIRYSANAEEWRRRVFERDSYTCQECGARNGNGRHIYLHAHHIKQFAYHPELRFDLNNGKTLCKNCHSKIKHVRYKKDLNDKKTKTLVADLDKVFSLFVRLRDADENGFVRCFTSGKIFHYKKIHAGHYISRRHYSTRWDERNVQPQSVSDNLFNQGNSPEFAQKLLAKYGSNILDDLIIKKNNRFKLERGILILLIKEYTEKVDKLKSKINE